MQDSTKEHMHEDQREQLPLFSSWGGWYTAVMLVLILLILLFYLFTNHFA